MPGQKFGQLRLAALRLLLQALQLRVQLGLFLLQIAELLLEAGVLVTGRLHGLLCGGRGLATLVKALAGLLFQLSDQRLGRCGLAGGGVLVAAAHRALLALNQPAAQRQHIVAACQTLLLLLAAFGVFLVARLVAGLQCLHLPGSHIAQRLLLSGQLLLQLDKTLLHFITAGQTSDLLAEYGLELQ